MQAVVRVEASSHDGAGERYARASWDRARSLSLPPEPVGPVPREQAPFYLGYLSPGGSTSSTQQRRAGAVFGAPSHRQHRARVSSSFTVPPVSYTLRRILSRKNHHRRREHVIARPGSSPRVFRTGRTRAGVGDPVRPSKRSRKSESDRENHTLPMIPARRAFQRLIRDGFNAGGGCSISSRSKMSASSSIRNYEDS